MPKMETKSVTTKTSALAYFEIDEWTQILSKLTDHNDRWNTSHADPLFRNILKCLTDTWITTLFYKALPHLYSYLSCKEILIIRELSKSWRDILDQFLECDQRWRDADQLGLQKVKLNLFQHPSLTRRERFTKLLEKMTAASQAKVVGGSVFIDNTMEENGYTQIDFRPFLWKCGHQIYHLCLNMIVGYNDSPIQSWKAVLNLLDHTPNLKTLNLQMTIYAEEDDYYGPFVWYQGLEKLFQERGLPAFDQLKSLKLEQYAFSACYDTDMPPCQAFTTAYGDQLEYLNISCFPSVVPENFKCLEHLTCAVISTDELNDFKKLNAGKLQTLDLTISQETILAYPLEHVECLNKFRNTLKSLKIRYSYDTHSNLIRNSNPLPNGLCLSNLQNLYLFDYQLCRNLSLKFLLNFPKLQTFYMGWSRNTADLYGNQGEENDSDLYDIGNYLNQKRVVDKNRFYNFCPIWNLLPFLNFIELEGNVGTEKYKSVCTRKERQLHQFQNKQ